MTVDVIPERLAGQLLAMVQPGEEFTVQQVLDRIHEMTGRVRSRSHVVKALNVMVGDGAMERTGKNSFLRPLPAELAEEAVMLSADATALLNAVTLPHDVLTVYEQMMLAKTADTLPLAQLQVLLDAIRRARAIGLNYAHAAMPGDTLWRAGEILTVAARTAVGTLTVYDGDAEFETIRPDTEVLIASKKNPDRRTLAVTALMRDLAADRQAAAPPRGKGHQVRQLAPHALDAVRAGVVLVGGTVTIAPEFAEVLDGYDRGPVDLTLPVAPIGGAVTITRTTVTFNVWDPYVYVLAIRDALYRAYGPGVHPAEAFNSIVRRIHTHPLFKDR